MNNYIKKYALFFLPFVIALFLEIFFLPVDFFTFRAWEALNVKESLGILNGPFFPDRVLTKTETRGELKGHSACATEKKDVLWMTDKYGYRKANVPVKKFPVVVIGDSNIAGAGLTQDDMFSEVLERKLHTPVYPIASRSVRHIFNHGLIRQSPPDVIILANIERNLSGIRYKLPKNACFEKLSGCNKIMLDVQLNESLQSAAVVVNRILKSNMLHYVRARINQYHFPGSGEDRNAECPILFLQGSAANREVPDEIIDATAKTIKQYSDFFTSQNIRFIFLPIPNKENIYYRYLGTSKPAFLESLIRKLRSLNVEVIDTQKAFDEASSKANVMLYDKDETHWNKAGVAIAAGLTADYIRIPEHTVSPSP